MNSLLTFRNIHMIGALGTSMSGLSKLLLKLGFCVSGSDKRAELDPLPFFLLGITPCLNHDKAVLDNASLGVYTSAVSKTDFEVNYLKSKGIPVISRAELLGMIATLYKTVIAVSGTHGKTTVTAMLGEIFSQSTAGVTLHVGGNYKEIISTSRETFITEACEYKKSFLTLRPDIALVLNVEYDHPDCYKSEEEFHQVFDDFCKQIKPSGCLITTENTRISRDTGTYLIGKDAYPDTLFEEGGYFTFTPVVLGKTASRPLALSVPGMHNVINALFALTTAVVFGIDLDAACNALSKFKGVDRRFQITKPINGARIILDYAHHPTEIKASIKTARMSTNNLTVYFQPHTYSRTARYFDRFLEALSLCNDLVIVEEYPARETPDMGKSATELYLALKNGGLNVKYCTLSEAKSLLHITSTPNDTVLILGAGDIDRIVE